MLLQSFSAGLRPVQADRPRRLWAANLGMPKAARSRGLRCRESVAQLGFTKADLPITAVADYRILAKSGVERRCLLGGRLKSQVPANFEQTGGFRCAVDFTVYATVQPPSWLECCSHQHQSSPRLNRPSGEARRRQQTTGLRRIRQTANQIYKESGPARRLHRWNVRLKWRATNR